MAKNITGLELKVEPKIAHKAVKDLELKKKKLEELYGNINTFKLSKSLDNEYLINGKKIKLNTSVYWYQPKNEMCMWYSSGIMPGNYVFSKDVIDISQWDTYRKHWDKGYTSMKHEKFVCPGIKLNNNENLLLTTQYSSKQFGVSPREIWSIQSTINDENKKICSVYSMDIQVNKKYLTKGHVLGKVLTLSKFTALTDDEIKTLKLPTKLTTNYNTNNDEQKEQKNNNNDNESEMDIEWCKFECLMQINLGGLCYLFYLIFYIVYNFVFISK